MLDKYCYCGCGVALTNSKSSFLSGHNGRKHIRFVVDESTGCWIWQLGINDKGYGQFQIRLGKSETGKRLTKTKRAHVHFWEEKNGPVPDGLEIDHLCHNRRCVNPDHLEAVTHAENVRRCSSTVLNADKIKYCKELKDQGLTFKAIGELLGTHRTTISKAINGVNWSDLAS